MMQARIARFYGFSHESIKAMSYKDLLLYYKCITHIDAEEMQKAFKINSYSMMDKNSRKKLDGMVERLRFKEDMPIMSMDQFAGKQWQKSKQP